MRNVRVSLQSIVLIVYITVLMTLSILPHYKYSTTYKELFVISIPFLLVYVIRYFNLISKTKWMIISLFVMVLFRFFYNTWMDISAAVNLSLMLFLCMLSYFILEAVLIRKSRNEMILVIMIISLMMAFVAFNTFREFATNPTVARMLANGTTENESINVLRNNNIGGFGFSYAIGMLAPYFALRFIKNIGKGRIVPGVLLFVDLLFCIYTQYTTLVLLSIFFVVFVFATRINRIGVRFFILFITGLLLLNIKNIFIFAARSIDLATLSLHLLDVVSMMNGTGTTSGRGNLYSEAFQLFLHNPILGANLLDESNLNIINESHSTMLTVLASGGIIGFMLYYGVLINMIANIKRMVPKFKEIKPVYYMLIILSVVNPITHFEIMAVTMLLIPLLEILRCN